MSFWTPDAKMDAFMASREEAERRDRIDRIATAFHKALGCSVCEAAEPCEGLAKLVSIIHREVT